MTRKYFKLGIQQLKDICNENRNDIAILKEVHHELTHRKTRSAVELRGNLEAYFKKNNVDKPTTGKTEKAGSSKVSKPKAPKGKSDKKKKSDQENKENPKPKKSKIKKPGDFSQDSLFEEPAPQSYDRNFSLVDSAENAQSKNTKWVTKLRDDKKYLLNLAQNSSILERQIEALDKYILELKNFGKSNTFTTLLNGTRLKENPDLYVYSFELEDPLEVFEGAKVEITIGTSQDEAKVAGIDDKTVFLEFEKDQGKVIESCTVKIDRTQLLRALHEKLTNVSNGEIESFNHDLVKSVFNNDSDSKEPELKKNVIGLDGLNDEQSLAIRYAIANEVSYIWGPPGTGKTKTLGVLIENFFAKEERSLIASNTNQAVDQVLLKLCEQLGKDHEAIQEGYILRRGKIDLKELNQGWGDYVDLDKIVARKSEALVLQADELEAKINKYKNELEKVEKILSAFKNLDEKHASLAEAKSLLKSTKKEKQSNSSRIKDLAQTVKDLKQEAEDRKAAGALRRLLLRNEQQIESDISNTKYSIEQLEEKKTNFPKLISSQEKQIKSLEDDLEIISKRTKGKDRDKAESDLQGIIKKMGPLEGELAKVRAELEGIKETVINNAKIVGATVTRTYLKQDEYLGFNNVIIDEASMVLLPSLYNVLGFASDRCIISGDFRQLAPIVETKQKEIHEEISKDIFSFSGVEELSQKGRNTKNLIMLKKQYRMQSNICNLVNSFMYQGNLETAKDQEVENIIPDFYENIVIIDTSKVFPFSQKKGTSYYNLMHAMITRNLINIFNKHSKKKLSIGVCSPYTAQARMHSSLNQDTNNVTAGTVHRFQGDEKDIMILDTVDSLGETQVGYWALSDLPSEDGSKLWNVAISRSKDHLFFIGNLTHLNTHLPRASFLRNILHSAQNSGQVVPVEEILKLSDLKEELKPLIKKFELDDATVEKGLFNNQDFEKVFLDDIQNAKSNIAIFSGFITPNRVAHYGDIFRTKIAEGVQIRCVTRPPKNNGSMRVELGTQALDALEAIGCVVDTRTTIHQKAAIIDDEISWFGSLNPLSHTSLTEETMARINNKGFASQLIQNLSLKFVKDTRGAAVAKENPECEYCGSRTSYNFGTYGKPDYWRCESCNKTKSLFARGKKIKDRSKVGENCPTGCGGKLRISNGSNGEFYGCNNYPSCTHTENG